MAQALDEEARVTLLCAVLELIRAHRAWEADPCTRTDRALYDQMWKLRAVWERYPQSAQRKLQ